MLVRYLLVHLFVTFFSIVTLYAQKNTINLSKNEISEIAEKKNGSDNLLINGIKYNAEKAKAKGNPMFEYDKNETKLFIKGHEYENINLIYNIYTDQLILANKQNEFSQYNIILNSSNIDSFYIGNTFFVNIGQHYKLPNQFKYFEVIYSGDDLFLKKYKKTYINFYNELNPFGEFSSQVSTKYIYHENKLIKANSKKMFLSNYEHQKKEIRKFMRKNGIKYKRANNESLKKLMQFCYENSK